MPAFQTQFSGGAVTNQTLQAINLMTNLVFPTQGNVWFVAPRTGNDQGNSGTSPSSPLKTLSAALSLATANQNDIVYLLSQSNTASQTTDYQTANLNWNKDGVHLIGVNNGAMIGARSRVSNKSDIAAFANLLTVSANNCLIKNLEVFQGAGSTNPTAASTCVTVSGQRNVFDNCQFSGVGDSTLDDTGSNDLTLTGGENYFRHCYIGLDTVIRASALAGTVISGTPARNIFEDCMWAAYTSSTSYKFMTVATGVDRFVRLINPTFYAAANISSSAIPTGAIGITTMNGMVIVENPKVYGAAQIVTADNAYVQVLGLNGLATGHLIGISQGVDAA